MDFETCLDRLSERSLLPANREAAFVVGSTARGWDNPGSDLDVSVVVPTRWQGLSTEEIRVPLDPETVATTGFFVDHRRWEVKYWLDSQIDQVIAKVSRSRFDSGEFTDDQLTRVEVLLLARIGHAVPLDGEPWLRARQEQVDASAFRSIVASRALNYLDGCTEDAVGLLEVDDVESALVSTKRAFSNVVEALLATYGEIDNAKWRARRMRAAAPKELSFADYWAVETMRDCDLDDPRPWITRVLELCQRISSEVRV